MESGCGRDPYSRASLSFISASNRLKWSWTGLFSAAVVSLISVSIQDIRPNSHDTSNFYLANVYQVIAPILLVAGLPPDDISPSLSVFCLNLITSFASPVCGLAGLAGEQADLDVVGDEGTSGWEQLARPHHLHPTLILIMSSYNAHA